MVPPCVRSFSAFDLFTLSVEGCDPANRGKPREVNILALYPKLLLAKRLTPLGLALPLAALVAIPTSNLALTQSPPANEITLANADTREAYTHSGCS